MRMLRKMLSLALALVVLVVVGCGSSEMPTNAGVDNSTTTMSHKIDHQIDYTEALLTAERGDLVLLDGRYLLVTEVDPANRNIRMRWFSWDGPAIWHKIDRMVDPRFAIMGGFWEFNTPQWRKNICGHINPDCP